MASLETETLRRTVLNDWHTAQRARMVAFGGWSMPLNYAGGVTREHIATRTDAGLFDICHMGRFRIAGAGATGYLASVLTNDANALLPGHAHYTLIANAAGGALDDAYLYCLGSDDFLLVVNAANRVRDSAYLHASPRAASVCLSDDSDALGMLALQGPRSAALLEQVLGAEVLPEPRRNRLRQSSRAGFDLIVARTGYTGEANGFEIFVPKARTAGLWQALVDAGAPPAGLGARDSLRLEAGLPLYGHELGLDRNGRDIPIFANRLARYGVRRPGNGRYLGVDALDAQRAEYQAIVEGALAGAPRWLSHLIQPLAVFDAKRPLRAGYALYADGIEAGYVTSGTSVPVLASRPDAGVPVMRPIGLALLRHDLRSDNRAGASLEVRDGRGGSFGARIVATNLPAPAA
ncbi:MAG: glycine cleavage system aminomethyltransferase GcvT [Burkholderiales bacterium]|nr:glycine cleavage system aminomethyltransferase GcvT [Burkholderiales bacterium]